MSEKWIKVYTFFDDLEAPQLEAILRENDIPVDVFYFGDSSVYSIFQPSLGKGEIRVRENYQKQAEEIIAAFKGE